MNKTPGHIVIFKTDDGKVSVDARFDAETAWLSLDQMAALFERDKSTVSRHIRNVFEVGEQKPEATVARIATVQKVWTILFCQYVCRMFLANMNAFA